jgi:aminodeoxyfutalosine synthase
VLLEPLQAAGVYAVSSAAVDRLADPEGSLGAVTEAGLAPGRLVVDLPPDDDPWPLLERVQRLRAACPGIRTFAPIPRSPDPLQPTTGYSDVKWVAIARLVLDSVSSIQADWALHGPKLAQVALLFGADDVDGVSAEEDTGAGRRRAPLEEIRRNIVAASLTAIERDARFTRRPA